jgi:hypothetical protein
MNDIAGPAHGGEPQVGDEVQLLQPAEYRLARPATLGLDWTERRRGPGTARRQADELTAGQVTEKESEAARRERETQSMSADRTELAVAARGTTTAVSVAVQAPSLPPALTFGLGSGSPPASS